MPKIRLKALMASVRRIVLTLVALAILFYWWVPMDYDLHQRKPDGPNPPVDPNLMALFHRGNKVLVVTAHPDDEAYYIGGTLTKLGKASAEVTVAICTYGDKAYYGPFTNVSENRRTRKAEAIQSLKTFGGKEVRLLGFTDGRLRNDEAVRAAIAREIERVKPTYILTFDDLYPIQISHRDHRRCGEAAVAAAKACGYHGWLMLFATGGDNCWIDVSDEWPGKEKMLAAHRSQFSGEKFDRVDATLMDQASTAAEHLKGTYAEPFRAVRL